MFTTSTLSTKANKSGETFNAVLAKAIVSDDWVIAKQGARVEGLDRRLRSRRASQGRGIDDDRASQIDTGRRQDNRSGH